MLAVQWQVCSTKGHICIANWCGQRLEDRRHNAAAHDAASADRECQAACYRITILLGTHCSVVQTVYTSWNSSQTGPAMIVVLHSGSALRCTPACTCRHLLPCAHHSAARGCTALRPAPSCCQVRALPQKQTLHQSRQVARNRRPDSKAASTPLGDMGWHSLADTSSRA